MFKTLVNRILSPPAFGLDISDLTVKFIHLTRSGTGIHLGAFGEIEIPAGMVIGGEIHDEAALARVLAAELPRAGPRRWFSRTRSCIASLPEEKSFVRVIELPNIRSEDVAAAVRWEVEGVIPLPAGELYYDSTLTPRLASSADHRDVLITAFPRTIVQAYHRLLLGAGYMPLALELESQAISRAVIPNVWLGDPSIIVDMGATRTSFIIFAGGSLIFTKSVAVGGRDFEMAIQSSLGVTAGEARRIKIEVGLNKNYREGQVFRALTPHLETLSRELLDELAFYREHPAKRHAALGDIARVILCGGDANLFGLERYLATSIKKLTVLGDPFAKFSFLPGMVPPIPKSQALKYTTAIGLALRGAGL